MLGKCAKPIVLWHPEYFEPYKIIFNNQCSIFKWDGNAYFITHSPQPHRLLRMGKFLYLLHSILVAL